MIIKVKHFYNTTIILFFFMKFYEYGDVHVMISRCILHRHVCVMCLLDTYHILHTCAFSHITKTCPCNILQYFTAVKMTIFR